MRQGDMRLNEQRALACVQSAADAGDQDAASWLRGEGFIQITSALEARFVRWEDADGRTSPRALEWARAVFERDDFTCADCGQRGGKLQSHHIQGWADHPELRFDLTNGTTLCVDCHAKKHPGRENLIRRSRYLKRRRRPADQTDGRRAKAPL